MSFLKLHREFLRRPFVAAFISGAGRKFHMTTKPLSTSHLASTVSLHSPWGAHALLGRGRSVLGAPLQSLPGGQGWRRTIPGIPGACPGSSMHQRIPAQFWLRPAGAPYPWPQGTSWGDRGPVPGGRVAVAPPVWEEEGLLMQKQEGAAVGLFRLALTCLCGWRWFALVWRETKHQKRFQWLADLRVTSRCGSCLLCPVSVLQATGAAGRMAPKKPKCNAGQLRSPRASSVSGVPLQQALAGVCHRAGSADCWALGHFSASFQPQPKRSRSEKSLQTVNSRNQGGGVCLGLVELEIC